MEYKKHSFSIAYKFILVTVAVVIGVTIIMTVQGTRIFSQFSNQREEDALAELSNTIAGQVEDTYSDFVTKTRLLSGTLFQKKLNPDFRADFLKLSFEPDAQILDLEIYREAGGKFVREDRIVNQSQIRELGLAGSFVEKIRAFHPLDFSSVLKGEIRITNGSLPEGIAISTVMIPLVKDDRGYFTHFAVADFRVDSLHKILKQIKSRHVYIADAAGQVVLAPSDQEVLHSTSVARNPLFLATQKKGSRFAEMSFVTPDDNVPMVGAYVKSKLGLTTLMYVEKDKITSVAKVVTNRTIVMAGYIVSIVIFIIALFSMGLTKPIERLAEVTGQIALGKFDISTDVDSRDEVGELARSIDHMVVGLRERDKVKNLLTKFHGTSVVEDMLAGEIQLGGDRKRVSVFFSDLRGFTNFSEGHSPEEVVEMLNEYFSIMVDIVLKRKGIVDKFVGDAMMAVWGAPHSTGQDSILGVSACLDMRIALNRLNEKRIIAGKSPIRMGMGLHSGDVISGNIGSNDRMEYTVIGDTVNMASRIESATKELETDLLISETVAEEVSAHFSIQFASEVEVKGKSVPLKLYKVLGYKDEKGEPREVI